MAKKSKGLYAKIEHEPIFHKTSIGRNPSLTKMNKSKRRQFKKYNGQGKQKVDNNHIISYIYRMKEITTNRKKDTMKKKIMLFAQLVSEIDISRYKQKEYVNIVKAIYWEIFGEKA